MGKAGNFFVAGKIMVDDRWEKGYLSGKGDHQETGDHQEKNDYQETGDHQEKLEPLEKQNLSRGFCAYQIVVKISGVVAVHIKDEQHYAIEQYGQSGFSGIAPEMVLAKFEAKEEMEDILIRWLHRIVSQQEVFHVLLNNYGSMPGYPLYIRVQDPGPFRPLTEALQVIVGLLKSNDCKDVQIIHRPRLVITRQVSKKREMEILLDFSGRSFREEMTVEEILLVKEQPGHQESGIVCRLMLSPKGLKRTEPN